MLGSQALLNPSLLPPPNMIWDDLISSESQINTDPEKNMIRFVV